MTRYYINDREVEVPPGFSSFDQMLRHVEDRYVEPAAVIREIHVDGRPLAAESLHDEDLSFGRTYEWGKIEIFTGTLTDVAVESIAGALDYLVKIEKAAPALAVKFQDFPEFNDFTNLGSLCEGFFFLCMLLDKLANGYKLELDEIIVQGASVREHLRKFVGIVKHLNEAQEKQEYLLIADIIEYEILPVVPVWKKILEAVSCKISPAR